MKWQNDLIFDIGMHRGFDSEFYLRKGFRVVAVEANPELVEQAEKKFDEFIKSGQLIILGKGLYDSERELDFYVNLDKDDWSAFGKGRGTRGNTRFKVIRVKTITFEQIIEEFGVPYYAKVDIEGADEFVVLSMLKNKIRPKYFSIEMHQLSYIGILSTLGYRNFKLMNQRYNGHLRCPNPPLEGRYVDFKFHGHTSGLFGRELPGEWEAENMIAYRWLLHKLDIDGARDGWYDLHAGLDVD